MSTATEIDADTLVRLPVEQEIRRREIKASHLEFMRHTWMYAADFTPGTHTEAVCAELDRAVKRYRQGKSTFLVVKLPFRHGKTDMVSRYFPAHFLGEFPGSEVLMASYSAQLTYGFSRYARNIMQIDEFRWLYPEVTLNPNSTSPGEWRTVDPYESRVRATGLNAGMAGRGYHLGIIDDYHGSQPEAESRPYRDRVWNVFAYDFMTRRAPVSITIIVATPRHIDDLLGRLPRHQQEDPDFPEFREIKFPAFDDSYPSGTLFPERYSQEWYDTQRSLLQSYGTAALLQCDPIARGGNMLAVDEINLYDDTTEWPRRLRWMRVVDFAHSERQRSGDDPDWTAATLLAFHKDADGALHLYIRHVGRIRGTTVGRDAYLQSLFDSDPDGTEIVLERTTDSIDAVEAWKYSLRGKRRVSTWSPSTDKVVRASWLEPIFEAGHVHVLRGEWLHEWMDEVRAFPSVAHDDQVDTLTAGYAHFTRAPDTSALTAW